MATYEAHYKTKYKFLKHQNLSLCQKLKDHTAFTSLNLISILTSNSAKLVANLNESPSINNKINSSFSFIDDSIRRHTFSLYDAPLSPSHVEQIASSFCCFFFDNPRAPSLPARRNSI